MKRISILLLICFPLFFHPTKVIANERRFAYTYETSVLAHGVREIEIWNTDRRGKEYFFRRLDQRVEYETGVASNLMTAFYLNYSQQSQDENLEQPGGTKTSTTTLSFSSEWKYKFTDRVADVIGFAAYVEGTVGPDENDIEGKLLFDKEISHFLFALNIVGEQEWEYDVDNGENLTHKEFKLQENVGIVYMLSNSFSFGLEGLHQNVISNNILIHSSIFAGPVLSYSAESWWVTATVLPQVKSFRGATTQNKLLDLNEYEKVQARLLFSFRL